MGEAAGAADAAAGKPLVSVVILTYRRFSRLADTLDTILRQDYPRMELVLSDDASEEYPAEGIDLLAARARARGIPVVIRRNEINLGLVAHSNLTARLCRGEYIKFLSPGDGFCSEDALSGLVALMEETGARVVTSPSYVCAGGFDNVRYQYPSGRRVRLMRRCAPRKLFSVLSASNIISAVGTLYARSFFEDGGFDEGYRNLDDWPTWLSLSRRGEAIPCAGEAAVYYMLDGMSAVNGTAFDSPLLREDLLRCLEREILPYMKQLPPRVRWIVRYRYETLRGAPTGWFHIRFWPLEGFYFLKKCVKRRIVRGK